MFVCGFFFFNKIEGLSLSSHTREEKKVGNFSKRKTSSSEETRFPFLLKNEMLIYTSSSLGLGNFACVVWFSNKTQLTDIVYQLTKSVLTFNAVKRVETKHSIK